MENKLPAGRVQPNTADTTFRLAFVERLYDGSPRWYNQDASLTHIQDVSGDYAGALSRETKVAALFNLAHERHSFYKLNNVSSPYLRKCVNPDCEMRSWESFDFASGKFSIVRDASKEGTLSGQFQTPDDRRAALESVFHDLECMAKGNWNGLQQSCQQCNQPMPLFWVSLIFNKWVYVLEEGGDELIPRVAIHLETPTSGFIYPTFRGGDFLPEKVNFTGGLKASFLPEIKSHVWHFFLSPVKLGRDSLQKLSKSPDQDMHNRYSRPLKLEELGVGVVQDSQPWSATQKLRFKPLQLKKHHEYIPLVDAFAWAAQATEFDYIPILSARQELVQNTNEQAKAFVSATLAQTVPKKKDKTYPWKSEIENDYEVADELVYGTDDLPPAYAGSLTVAQAWIDRYQRAYDYLSTETNFACNRMWFALRFSEAHRIIDAACQERVEPDALPFGLMHWNHVLRYMAACPPGSEFTQWLVHNDEARDRIPRTIVLNVKPKTLSSVTEEQSLRLQIMSFLSPALVAGSSTPAQDLRTQLEQAGVTVDFGKKGILGVADLSLSISNAKIRRYVESLPKVLDASDILEAGVAPTWQQQLEVFTHTKDLLEGVTLLTELIEYVKAFGEGESEWERNAYKDKPSVAERVKKRIEAPAKATKFLAEQTNKVLKYSLSKKGTPSELIDKLENAPLAALSEEEADVLAASRSLRTFKWVGAGVKVLAGPIGVILGGCDLIMNYEAANRAIDSGDYSAGAAYQVKAMGSSLSVMIAGAESWAFFNGAEFGAFAGPIGWIAAGLMLIGGILLAWAEKSPLQEFASHCFLGKYYGRGDEKTGMAWMGDWTWSGLLYAAPGIIRSDRFIRQRWALLRLLCGFTIWTGPDTHAGGGIYAGYVPPGARFEFEVDIPGLTEPIETYAGVIYPDRKEGEWKSRPSRRAIISVEQDEHQAAIMRVDADPGDHRRVYAYNFRVRLVLDGAGEITLRVTTDWVEAWKSESSEYHIVSSGEPDVKKQERQEIDETLNKIPLGAAGK